MNFTQIYGVVIGALLGGFITFLTTITFVASPGSAEMPDQAQATPFDWPSSDEAAWERERADADEIAQEKHASPESFEHSPVIEGAPSSGEEASEEGPASSAGEQASSGETLTNAKASQSPNNLNPQNTSPKRAEDAFAGAGIGRISAAEAEFLKTSLAAERERQAQSVIRDEDRGHTILDRVFTHGGSAAGVLRTKNALVEKLPADEGEAIEVNTEDEWTDFLQLLRKTKEPALTVKLGPGTFRYFTVIEGAPHLTFIGTLPEGIDLATRTRIVPDESNATIMQGVTVYREGAEGTLAFRNLVMNRRIDLRERSVVRCENVIFQRNDLDGGRMNAGSLTGDVAFACSNCLFIGGPNAYHASAFNLAGQGLIQLNDCRFVAASVLTIGSYLATQHSHVVLIGCTFDRSRLIRTDNTKEDLLLEAINCTFYDTPANIEHRNLTENSTPFGCSLEGVAKDCVFEKIAPIDYQPAIMKLVEHVRMQGGPIVSITIPQPGCIEDEKIITMLRLPNNWGSKEAGDEIEGVVTHWVVNMKGEVKPWNELEYRYLGTGSNIDPNIFVPALGYRGLEDLVLIPELYPADADLRSLEVRARANDGVVRGLVRRFPWCIRPAWLRFDAATGKVAE